MQTNTPFRRAVQLSCRFNTHRVAPLTRSECPVLIKSTIVRSVRATSSSLRSGREAGSWISNSERIPDVSMPDIPDSRKGFAAVGTARVTAPG